MQHYEGRNDFNRVLEVHSIAIIYTYKHIAMIGLE